MFPDPDPMSTKSLESLSLPGTGETSTTRPTTNPPSDADSSERMNLIDIF